MTWILQLETNDPAHTNSYIAYLKKNGVTDRYIKTESTFDEYIKELTEKGFGIKEINRKLDTYKGFKTYVSSHIQQRKRNRLLDEWAELYRK